MSKIIQAGQVVSCDGRVAKEPLVQLENEVGKVARWNALGERS